MYTKDPGSGLEAESKTNPDGGTDGDGGAGKQPGPQTQCHSVTVVLSAIFAPCLYFLEVMNLF